MKGVLIMIHGLSTLMESIHQTESYEKSNDKLMEMMEGVIDDGIMEAVTGEDIIDPIDDSVNSDMDGNGIGSEEEEALDRILDNIPPDDETIDDEMDDTMESILESVMAVVEEEE
jgi:hypothetical protein